MVMEIMTFIRAVRTGDWDLHLEAPQLFVKSFVVHDMLHYARMIPVYLAEMETGAAVEGRVSLAQAYAAAATTRQEKSVTMPIGLRMIAVMMKHRMSRTTRMMNDSYLSSMFYRPQCIDDISCAIFKVFRYSFSEAIPIFFNWLKNSFFLGRSLSNFHQ